MQAALAHGPGADKVRRGQEPENGLVQGDEEREQGPPNARLRRLAPALRPLCSLVTLPSPPFSLGWLPQEAKSPAILEIPSKEHPYDPEQDAIHRRTKLLLGLRD